MIELEEKEGGLLLSMVYQNISKDIDTMITLFENDEITEEEFIEFLREKCEKFDSLGKFFFHGTMFNYEEASHHISDYKNKHGRVDLT